MQTVLTIRHQAAGWYRTAALRLSIRPCRRWYESKEIYAIYFFDESETRACRTRAANVDAVALIS